MGLIIIQRLFLEAFLDLMYFPLWWYTGGAKHALFWCLDLLKSGNARLAPSLWLKNIFVPMFGQYDWQGKIISFFMRLVQIIFRTILLIVWLVVCFAIFLAWLILPGVVIWGLLWSLKKI